MHLLLIENLSGQRCLSIVLLPCFIQSFSKIFSRVFIGLCQETHIKLFKVTFVEVDGAAILVWFVDFLKKLLMLGSIIGFSGENIHLDFHLMLALHVVQDICRVYIVQVDKVGVDSHKTILDSLRLIKVGNPLIIFVSVQLWEQFLWVDLAPTRHSSATLLLRMMKVLAGKPSRVTLIIAFAIVWASFLCQFFDS